VYGSGRESLEVTNNCVQIAIDARDKVQMVWHDDKGEQTQAFAFTTELQAVDDRIDVPRVYQYGEPI
jgi:hypothetical protein